jgi:hypothetical protein
VDFPGRAVYRDGRIAFFAEAGRENLLEVGCAALDATDE